MTGSQRHTLSFYTLAIKKDIDHHHVLLESDGGSQSLIGPQHSETWLSSLSRSPILADGLQGLNLTTDPPPGYQRVRKGRQGPTTRCMRTAMRSCFPSRTSKHRHGNRVARSFSLDADGSGSPWALTAGRCIMWIPVIKYGQGVHKGLETGTGTTKRAMWSFDRC